MLDNDGCCYCQKNKESAKWSSTEKWLADGEWPSLFWAIIKASEYPPPPKKKTSQYLLMLIQTNKLEHRMVE